MLLTNDEREFLAAFVQEATTDPFKGPATEELHRRDIYYTDLQHLLSVYYHETPPDQGGFGGRAVATLPPCPWTDRAMAVGRDHQVQMELEQAAQQALASGNSRRTNGSS
jgi:hypothetical protein